MAQRQRRDWRDSFSIMRHFWQTKPARSGGAAVRLEPVLGVFAMEVFFTFQHIDLLYIRNYCLGNILTNSKVRKNN